MGKLLIAENYDGNDADERCYCISYHIVGMRSLRSIVINVIFMWLNMDTRVIIKVPGCYSVADYPLRQL